MYDCLWRGHDCRNLRYGLGINNKKEKLTMLEKIAKILRDYKGDGDIVITEETTFKELELDSLDTVDLIMVIEEAFSVTIEMDGTIESVGSLMKTIENSQKAEL